MIRTFSLSLLALVVPFSLACEVTDPCDPDQVYENGLCVPASPEPEPPVEECMGGAPSIDGTPNPGDACTEGGDECTGGTLCAAPRQLSCVALCGPCDAFAEGCPNGLSCLDFGEAFVCM